MRISARNQLPATVRAVTQGQVMAEVVVKSTEVMLSVDD